MADIKKLMEGLGAENITVRAIAAQAINNGVYVSLKVGRLRGVISLPPQLVGINPDAMANNTKSIFNEYVSLGKLSFIPGEVEGRLSKIEGAIRYKIVRATLSDDFVPISRYLILKESFEKARKAYFDERDAALQNWDRYITMFREGMDVILDSFEISDSEKTCIRKSIMESIPSKEHYASSFYMNLNVRAFPGQPTSCFPDKEIEADVMKSWKNAVLENATSCIQSLVQEAFLLANGAIATYADNNKISTNTINALLLMSQKIKESNIFRNPFLKATGDSLEKLTPGDTPDQQAEIIEDVLLNAYSYAKETGLELKFKRGLPKKSLEDLYKLKMQKAV